MSPLTLLLFPGALWAGYAAGAHLWGLGSIRRGPRRARRLALTFDDGPDPVNTPKVLALLRDAGVRATFFLVGERAARARELVREMVARGHEVGNHTWSHRNLWTCGPRRTEREISRAHELLGELTGRQPRFFRPPWGMVNLAVFPTLRRLQTPCVLWSVQPEGLRPVAPREMAARVIRRARPGDIVDLHDAEGVRGAPTRLLEALPPMLEGLGAAGYACVPLAELLSDA
ncbi:MAG: polysaccharide deacetylase family protein [Candidatus Rokubacteria bacterium]|nr:polysaccharide deacetylase family protein [Candidatus Rokubacteria bacterium]